MNTLLSLSNSFGPVGYLLLMLSCIMVTLIIERSITIFRLAKFTSNMTKPITKLVERGEIVEARKLAEQFPLIYKSWLLILFDNNPALASDKLTLSINRLRTNLERPLEWLNLFALIAPMLGLLGTIWGMSNSFHELAQSLANNGINKMIGYLSEAMYATAFGILLALISMLGLYVLRYKAQYHLSECEDALNEVYLAFMTNHERENQRD